MTLAAASSTNPRHDPGRSMLLVDIMISIDNGALCCSLQ